LSSSFELRCEEMFLNQSSNPQQQTVSCTSRNRALVDSKKSLQGTRKTSNKGKKEKQKRKKLKKTNKGKRNREKKKEKEFIELM
jgi:hypothetical protein